MAKRGSIKRLSVDHENFIAKLYRGIRSPSSGGAVTDAGDVRTDDELFECKLSGSPGNIPKRKPKMIREFEKITAEAWAEGKEPAMCLRYWDSSSPLANREGWIDFTVRLASDDAERGS